MIEIVPYKPEHMAVLDLQPKQTVWLESLPCLAERFAEGAGFTALDAQSRAVVGAAGVCVGATLVGRLPLAWAAIAAWAGPYMFQVTRSIRVFLDTAPQETIYAAVNPKFDQAVKWAGMLKFRATDTVAYHNPNGEPLTLYARQTRPEIGLPDFGDARPADVG